MRLVGRLGEDARELVGALGRVVGPAGRVGDRHQRVLVDRAPEAATAASAHRRRSRRRRTPRDRLSPGSLPTNCAPHRGLWAPGFVRPEPDRVDADAAAAACCGGLDRLGPGVARPVGQEDDDGRGVGALRDRRGRLPRAGRPRPGSGATLGSISAIASMRREDRAADRRPAAGRQALRRRRAGPPGRSSAPGRSRRSRRTRRCRSGWSSPGAR